MTGGRIKRAKDFIGNEPFLLTYGDGVADVDIASLVNFHKNHSKLVTMTSVQPEGRFGALQIDADLKVSKFLEKPKGDGAWINGGYFVCQPEVLDYIENDETVFEQEPLMNLANEGNIFTYQHHGFWRCMDTLRDKQQLNAIWDKGNAPWKNW
jgi:glucose-1-phosphate cytidylyltransferase